MFVNTLEVSINALLEGIVCKYDVHVYRYIKGI